MRIFYSFLLLFLSLCCAGLAAAQEELAARLQVLNEEIEVSKSDLERVGARYAALDADVKSLSQQISKLQAQESEAEAELLTRTEQRATLDKQIAESESKTRELRELYRKRVRALYMRGNRGFLSEIAGVGSQAMFVRSAYFLSKVQAFDASLLQTISETLTLTEYKRSELNTVMRLQQELKDTLADQRERMAKRLSEQQVLAGELKRERQKRESLLATLNAQALRLETVLASLTNAGESPQRKSAKKNKRQTDQATGFSSFEGRGLAALKGKLRMPVAGRIVQSFGKRAQQGAPPRKGVEVLTAEVSPISALAAGRVLFVGRMPEFNTVLILDHGARYYSLYGRLSKVSVSKGQEVEAGEILGKSSDPKVISPNLYIEIRSAGVALDPEAFFEKS